MRRSMAGGNRQRGGCPVTRAAAAGVFGSTPLASSRGRRCGATKHPGGAVFARMMVLAAGAVLFGVTTASAQDHRASFTGFLGSAAYSGLAAGAADELVLEPGAFAGAHAELFFGRLGLRLGGGYARPSLENDASTGLTLMTGDA